MVVKLPGNDPELLPVTKQSGSRKYRVIKDGVLHSVFLTPKTIESELADFEAMLLVTVESGEQFPINKITQHLITIVNNGFTVSKWMTYSDNLSNIAKVSDIDGNPIADGEEVDPPEPVNEFIVSQMLVVNADFPTIDTAMASIDVPDGSTLRIIGEYTYDETLVLSRPMRITADSPETGILQTPGSEFDPVSLISIQSDDVKLDNITLKQKKTTDTSVETAISAMQVYNGLEVTNCVIEYMEFGALVRASNWKFLNNQFVYRGATSNTRRALGIYRVAGECEISGNQFVNEVSGNLRAINLISSSGSNVDETITGDLKIYANSQVGNMQQFYIQDNFNGPAGSFSLDLRANMVNETSGFVILFGVTSNYGDLLSSITLLNNSLSNVHSGGGKGAIAIDGTGSFRSSPLLVTANNNVLSNTVFRSDFTEANGSSGAIVGYTSSMSVVEVSIV
jgi:hypothetical protein